MTIGNNQNNTWKYKNLMIVFIGIIFTLILSRIEGFHNLLVHLGGFGYLGAFLGGILFVSTFTVATGALVLAILAQTLQPLEISLIAGFGAVVGDLTIFRFIRNGLSSEIEEVYDHLDKKNHLRKLFHSRYFNWMLPILGAVIIASPLPDELGVSLLGVSKMRTVNFLILSFLLNSFGIFFIIAVSKII